MTQILMKKWLFVCCIAVILMVFIGGLTRLTNSGLSIVEWNPVTGVIPPLNNEDWQNEFAKYQTSPEYKFHNINMKISEFKFIFWLEFIHRFAGRITFLLYILPLIYCITKRQIQKKNLLSHFAILILFCTQGFIGWYMVKSGLVNHPYISHFRLGVHLIIAITIYTLLFLQFMNKNFDILLISSKTNLTNVKFVCLLSIIMVYLQIFLGALVAGLNAGLIYNSFPLMGDKFIPQEITLNFNLANWHDPVFIQFIHRIGAYIVCFTIGILIFQLLKIKHPKLNKLSCYISTILALQMSAGVITILYSVPIIIALVHQLGAIILLSCLLWCFFLIKSA